MKTFGKIVLTALAVLGLLLAGLTAYTNLAEGRSLRSWAIERFIWLTGSKKHMEKQSQAALEQQLADYQAKSDVSFANPEKEVGQKVTETTVDGMQVFSWNDKKDKNQKVILYIHGGAYVAQPSPFHFSAVADMAKELDAKVVFPIYPKAPRYTYKEAFPKMETLYQSILADTASATNVTIMGDSAGGGFSLGFAMYARDKGLAQPKDIVLLSPWLDVKTDNPEIADYEGVDAMLSAWLPQQVGAIWAGGEDGVTNPYVSPIYGDLTGLGKISIFIGTHDILFPDNTKLHQLLEEQGITHNYTVADKMFHVYAIAPIPEGETARQQIVQIIGS